MAIKCFFDKNHVTAKYEWPKNKLDDNFKIVMHNKNSL